MTELKGMLENLYTQLMLNGKQDKADQPTIIRHIIETLFMDRLRDIYNQTKEQLLRMHRTPFKSLVGLVDDQIHLINANMLLEHMNAIPMPEEFPEKEDSSEPEESPRPDESFEPDQSPKSPETTAI